MQDKGRKSQDGYSLAAWSLTQVFMHQLEFDLRAQIFCIQSRVLSKVYFVFIRLAWGWRVRGGGKNPGRRSLQQNLLAKKTHISSGCTRTSDWHVLPDGRSLKVS